jgi:putative transposase
MEFQKHSHSIGNNAHHIEWCTKYRYNMFRKPENRSILKETIIEVAKRHKIKIVEIGITPDHIHMIVELHPTMSQSKAMQLLKGASSHAILRRIEKFRLRYPKGHLWSRGNFKDTVGRITYETAKNYVRNQMRIHQTNLSGFI